MCVLLKRRKGQLDDLHYIIHPHTSVWLYNLSGEVPPCLVRKPKNGMKVDESNEDRRSRRRGRKKRKSKVFPLETVSNEIPGARMFS